MWKPSLPYAFLCALTTMALLSGCVSLGDSGGKSGASRSQAVKTGKASRITLPARNLEPTHQGREAVMFALGLIGVDYRFGGKNPEAGLDCSGMVSYIYGQATRVKVSGSAADIAKKGRRVKSQNLRPGDLVFFNTLNRPRSHVGIYIGDGRFVHAPSSNGQVRIDPLDNTYYANRFEEGRTYFD